MNRAGFGYETFESDGRQEWLFRVGDAAERPILFLPPLFEEMNRSRALLAETMRSLAMEGFSSWLPDLGGSGESEAALETMSWSDWRHDVSAAAAHVVRRTGARPLIAACRGGALLDHCAQGCGWWRLAPVEGRSLVRDMERSGLAGVAWAGYRPNAGMRDALAQASPQEVSSLRVVRLGSDPGAADVKLAGPALWRRSEPGRSTPLALLLAADIRDWAARCVD